MRRAALLLVLPLLAVLVFGAPFAQAISHLQSFSGAPSAPQPWRPTGWDIAANNFDSYRGDGLGIDPMDASHSATCGAPPATHRINTLADTVFICSEHLMTAMNAGYGAIYLTPDAQVDFTSGEAVITFNMSTKRGSGRDWVDLWITPYQDNLVLPLDIWLPAYQGPPKNAVHVRMDNGGGGTIFKGDVIRGFQASGLPGGDWRAYEQVLTTDSARRDNFELRISRTHIKFGMPAHNLWWLDTSFADLGWSKGVVQFGHHAYNPEKGCGSSTDCYNTWHWDQVAISSVAPLSIIRGNEAVVKAATPRVTFPSAAPADASLRFAAVGASIEVSFNDGQTWQAAHRQAQERNATEHWSSYWTPAPAGATSVRFRGQGTWAGAWMAQHVSFWAQGEGSDPPPAVTPTATPPPSTATPTVPLAPTSTPMPTGTSVVPTATPAVPTATSAVATATATLPPSSVCERVYRLDGLLVYVPASLAECVD